MKTALIRQQGIRAFSIGKNTLTKYTSLRPKISKVSVSVKLAKVILKLKINSIQILK